jgi:NADH-quinone oxidoreductase subunit L
MDPHVEAHVHESPPVMTVPLVILALLSIVGGLVGIPHALKGADHFHHFLAPVISEAPAAPGQHAEAEGVHLVSTAHAVEHPAPGNSGEHAVAAGSEGGHHDMMHLYIEWGLMAASLVLALLGIGIAYFLYLVDPKTPAEIAATFKRTYRALYNKYFVDELYDVMFVQSIRRGSEWLWHMFDDWFIDGMVNGSARVVGGFSAVLKRLQTGYVQQYAVVMLVGIVVLIVYYLFW